MTFARLTRGDWVATVAALALLLVMSIDWYSTDTGEQARRDAEQADTSGAESGQPGRQIKEDAQIIRNRHEKNAWQATPFADRLILFVLLAAVILAIGAAWLRAANRRFAPPWTPSAIATGVGLAGLVLLAARIAQKPAAEAGAVVKLGAPLGLVCIGLLTIGARLAWNAERDGSAWSEGKADATGTGDAADDDEDTSEREAIRRPPVFDQGEPRGATAVAAPPMPAEQPATLIEPAAAEQPAAVDEPVASDPAPGEAEPLAPAETAADEPFAPAPADETIAERERRRAEREQRRAGGRRGRRRGRRR